MVFFQTNSSQLSAGARAVVDEAALAFHHQHPGNVMIATGTAFGDDPKLVEPRFLAVRQALIADGVASGLISRSAITEARFSLGDTGNERVEITLVAKLIS
jgi:hypothetical protein